MRIRILVTTGLIAGMFLLGGCGGEMPEIKVGQAQMLYSKNGVDWIDGVAVGWDGRVYFSEGENVMRLKEDGTATVWAKLGQPMGHKIRSDGTHIVCDRKEEAVFILDEGGSVMKKITHSEGNRKFGAPNDVCLDEANGGFYFTVPNSWDYVNLEGELYYTDREGKTKWVRGHLPYSNGLALSADGEWLFMSSGIRNRIDSFPVKAPGEIGELKLFSSFKRQDRSELGRLAAYAPDGICFDERGFLYVAHFGKAEVHVVDKEGELVKSIGAFMPRVMNVAMSGSRLYMCGGGRGVNGVRGSIYTVKIDYRDR